ncbi:MAG TPA: VWA domain-containing protein [Pyrinomonadaceae bacterium]|jgi:VWFA-related protein
MRKLAACVLLLSLFSLQLTQTPAQSRARRVGENAPTPAPAPAPTANPQQRQPKLGGAQTSDGTAKRPQTGADASRQAEMAEEVGEEEVVRVSTALVTIPVSVMDRNGKYVADLRKEDFRIYEDGTEQEIAYFATVEKPFTVALVIDTSNSTAFRLEDIQDAAIAFVNQLRAEDRVLVVSFDDQIRVLSEATSDRYALRDAIRRTRTGGGTKLYDAVDFVIKQRLDRIEGRKAIVLFTDGVDTTSKRASYESTLRDAEELDATVYPVQYDTYAQMGGGNVPSWPGGGGRSPYPGGRRSRYPGSIGRFPFPFPFPLPGGGTIGGGGGGGAGSSRGDYERGDRYLHGLADRTGGRLHEARDLYYLSQSFANIAEELRRQYSLGYYPKRQSQIAERRSVRVRVYRPNLAVRARDSYTYKPSGAADTAQDNQRRQQQQQQQPAPPELRRRQFIANDERGTMKDELKRD